MRTNMLQEGLTTIKVTLWIKMPGKFFFLVITVVTLTNNAVTSKEAEGNENTISDDDNIPGVAGKDYPTWNHVPKTSFRCKDYEYAGYFGDVETGCQIYHVCFPDGRNASFYCVNGTVFNQRYFVCDWWFNFDCSKAPDLYNLNLFKRPPLPVLPPVRRQIFVPSPKPKGVKDKKQAQRKPTSPRRKTGTFTTKKPQRRLSHVDNCYCPCLNKS
ncbi:uncharacterized protein LOC106458640 isoform X2 [Limulus polyphemus]|uniref:Uncharacterized protein LOC106458640 isoform X2 n=1 Tax=Limulus polyphemus TaxID=6850 RepID=A0ABM1SAG2_LIMPO|nr:uncharacterized protein LOC106458640 isoform X2 [Limulus polyphemus]